MLLFYTTSYEWKNKPIHLCPTLKEILVCNNYDSEMQKVCVYDLQEQMDHLFQQRLLCFVRMKKDDDDDD